MLARRGCERLRDAAQCVAPVFGGEPQESLKDTRSKERVARRRMAIVRNHAEHLAERCRLFGMTTIRLGDTR